MNGPNQQQLTENFEAQILKINPWMGKGAWLDYSFAIGFTNPRITQFLEKDCNDNQKGLFEVGTWQENWLSPDNLIHESDLIRLSVNFLPSEDKLERTKKVAELLEEHGLTLHVNEAREYIVVPRTNLSSVFAAIEMQ